MKRCPECYEVYENTEKFCEVDGNSLLSDPALSIVGDKRNRNLHGNRQPWLTGLIGVVVGVLLCASLYGIYSLLALQPDSTLQATPVSTARQEDPAPPASRAATAPIPELNPEAEEEESPEADASPDSNASADTAPDDKQAVVARLNQGPVSTGQAAKANEQDATVRTIIQMNDGTSLEVDAAWEDRQGVWYRRGGLVSFVESERVKAITARTEPKASPSSQ